MIVIEGNVTIADHGITIEKLTVAIDPFRPCDLSTELDGLLRRIIAKAQKDASLVIEHRIVPVSEVLPSAKLLPTNLNGHVSAKLG
jgi:hypothetical protein